MRILGIDYGDRHVGLAVSDRLLVSAQPLTTYILQDREADNAAYFRELVRAQEITEIVLGLPLRMDGSSGTRADKTRAFGKWLEKTVGLPVSYWDERLTTHQAIGLMQEQKVRAKARRNVVNQIAAVLILQAYLEGHCLNAPPPDLP